MRNIFMVLGCLSFWSATLLDAQVVRFRLEATDSMGAPIDSVVVGESFLLKTYTQHVGGFSSADNAGVFAAYLDIHYDNSLAEVGGPVEYGPLYSNGKSVEFAPGLLDNIGGFSSSPGTFPGATPIGIEEEFVFSVPMQAAQSGELQFVGMESLTYPQFDVLVYGADIPVPARDIDFGSADLRVDFGSVSLSVQPVPEPNASWYAWASILIAIPFVRRRGRQSTDRA